MVSCVTRHGFLFAFGFLPGVWKPIGPIDSIFGWCANYFITTGDSGTGVSFSGRRPTVPAGKSDPSLTSSPTPTLPLP